MPPAARAPPRPREPPRRAAARRARKQRSPARRCRSGARSCSSSAATPPVRPLPGQASCASCGASAFKTSPCNGPPGRRALRHAGRARRGRRRRRPPSPPFWPASPRRQRSATCPPRVLARPPPHRLRRPASGGARCGVVPFPGPLRRGLRGRTPRQPHESRADQRERRRLRHVLPRERVNRVEADIVDGEVEAGGVPGGDRHDVAAGQEGHQRRAARGVARERPRDRVAEVDSQLERVRGRRL